MSSKDHRSGGKFGGSHTTLIPAAGLLVDVAAEIPEVTRIVPGMIKAGLRSVNGKKRVKFTDEKACILLCVRDNVTHQEVRVYTTDINHTRLILARSALAKNISISFKGKVFESF